MITNNHTTNLIKVCSKCSEQKSIDQFVKNQSRCKSCRKARRDLWNRNNKEHIAAYNKQYEKLHKEKVTTYHRQYVKGQKCKEYFKQYKEIHKDQLKSDYKQWRGDNGETLKTYQKEYRKSNKEKINTYRKDRYKNDVSFRILHNARTRIQRILKRATQNKSIKRTETFGCSVQEVIKHIESQFKEGMSWKNYGYNTWHIDHIKPLISFNLKDPEQIKAAWHYTNLQPLWAKDNMSKGDRF